MLQTVSKAMMDYVDNNEIKKQQCKQCCKQILQRNMQTSMYNTNNGATKTIMQTRP